jgi:hypothetical protein
MVWHITQQGDEPPSCPLFLQDVENGIFDRLLEPIFQPSVP